MKKILMALLILLMSACTKEQELFIATTTSLDNSGLLEYIIPYFEEETEIKVNVVAVGTGAALQMGRDGDVDILLVHAKDLELQFIKDGYGEKRSDIMYNDFVFVGPSNLAITNLSEALTYIYENELPFYSRGDNSGTHFKELSLWDSVGFDVESFEDWYLETGQGMGSTINMANLDSKYTFTDRGTFLSMKDDLDLVIAYENPVELINQYGVIKINPDMYDINEKNADKFYEWIISDAQSIITEYKKYGEQLFFPNA
ncbi:substrate-binding domain-containing protein [Mycoplasmatota bacterium WC44]